jgi:hypothetical protein
VTLKPHEVLKKSLEKWGSSRKLDERPEQDLVHETGTTIKWAVGGALIGAVVLGGLGFWKFGVTGLAIGAIAGGVVGGVIGGWFYFSA